jgi:hypothetical protein
MLQFNGKILGEGAKKIKRNERFFGSFGTTQWISLPKDLRRLERTERNERQLQNEKFEFKKH